MDLSAASTDVNFYPRGLGVIEKLGASGIKTWVLSYNGIFYLLVCSTTFAVSFLLWMGKEKLRGRRGVRDGKSRAWIELDMKHLAHNVAEFKRMLPEDCKMMPAVKANAYGHGASEMAGELQKLGIDAFCVASMEEGIELRRDGIKGRFWCSVTRTRQLQKRCLTIRLRRQL